MGHNLSFPPQICSFSIFFYCSFYNTKLGLCSGFKKNTFMVVRILTLPLKDSCCLDMVVILSKCVDVIYSHNLHTIFLVSIWLKAPLCIGPLPFVPPLGTSLAVHIAFRIHFSIKVKLQNPLSYDSHFFLCFVSLDQDPNPKNISIHVMFILLKIFCPLCVPCEKGLFNVQLKETHS